VLGDAAPIEAAAAGYRLRANADSVDAKRFERLVGEGREALARGRTRRAAERLRTALALWHGRPFSGAGEAAAFALERERLAEVRLLALEERIAAELELGADAGLVPELEALVREHPYRERFWRHLMLALYRAGRQADALAAYRAARDTLDRELGLQPTDELRRLEQAILLHEVPAAKPAEPHHLPAPMTSFVGRTAELAEVERLLAEKRLITVTGVGGVGKTRLALEAAARAAPDSPDGVVFVDLAGVADPGLVPRHVARALDVRADAARQPADQLTARLRDAELLLVLDNCEHLRAACGELAAILLTACPHLRILATSRQPLGVPGELDYAVPPLAVPANDADCGELRSSEAVRLFVARARETRPRLVDDATAVAAAARVCRDLDGLPLAIELAAAHAKALTVAEIADRLSDRFRFLVSRHRLTPARHRTLEEAMAWSYELLGDEERRLLAGLSVFTGGFVLEAAAAVCLRAAQEQALPRVERLVDASLVVAEEADGGMRYRLLETVRQYAAGRLDGLAGTAELRRRHAEYYLGLAEAAEEDLRRRHSLQSRVGSRLHAEYANLTAALAWSVETANIETGLRIAAALVRFWIERDYATEADRWLELLLQKADDTPAAVRAKASVAAWNVASVRGHATRAERHARHAVELYHAVPDDPGAAGALFALGALQEQRGEYAEGSRLLEEALERHRATGDEMGARRSLHLLGNIARETRDVERSRHLLREALARARAAGDPFHEGGVLHSLGDAELEAGEIAAAEQLYREALGIGRLIGGYRIVTYCIAGLAASAAARDDSAAAAHLWSAARALERELGFRMRATARTRYERRLAAIGASASADPFAACRGAEAVLAAAVGGSERGTQA
jgi:predicted ATPase/DNA-binding SARP family transcriptional activator